MNNYLFIEFLRIVIFIGLITFYFTTTFGLITGGVHLFLIMKNPKKYGMSKVVNQILNRRIGQKAC